jgi:hypothetical protein
MGWLRVFVDNIKLVNPPLAALHEQRPIGMPAAAGTTGYSVLLAHPPLKVAVFADGFQAGRKHLPRSRHLYRL